MTRASTKIVDLVSSDSESANERSGHFKKKTKRRLLSSAEKKRNASSRKGQLSEENILHMITVDHPGVRDKDNEADDEDDENICQPHSSTEALHDSSKPGLSSSGKKREELNFVDLTTHPKQKFARISGNAGSKRSVASVQDDESDDVVPGKPKGRLWLHSVEVPLKTIKELGAVAPNLLPMKQRSIADFFSKGPATGSRIPTNASAPTKPKKKPSPKKSLASVNKASPDESHMSGDDSSTTKRTRQTSPLSAESTVPTSALGSPKSTVTKAAARITARGTKRKVEHLEASNSESEVVYDGSEYCGSEVSSEPSSRLSVDEEIVDDSDASKGISDVLSDVLPELSGKSLKKSTTTRVTPASKQSKTKLLGRLIGDDNEPDDPDSEDNGRVTKGAASQTTCYVDNFKYNLGIDVELPPISNIDDIFADMTTKAVSLGLTKLLDRLNGRKLKVATMCSGTESPLLALQLVAESLRQHGLNFEIDHQFSAEIVAFKQAYIERNFAPPIIFRDIKELSIEGAVEATTAYGGTAKIPGGADILITGFSCVDFSSLNNKKKTIEGGGESGDTFFAMKDYANIYRPKIIILENVCKAPWDDIEKKHMPKIGYAAKRLLSDTKEYYIPHTRLRGYMICVDKQAYKNPEKVLENWVKLMNDFKRPASSSVEEFLLPQDDPRVVRGRFELVKTDNRRNKEVEWTRCSDRHQAYRGQIGLGQKHPITQWVVGGLSNPVEWMWRDWLAGQVERVWDVIDIAWQRNLNRGFDHQYKVRCLDLSQNVDRITDTTRAGITGCITPSGIPFSTLRGGPIIGVEALALQGLPIDKLQITRESQGQLQDLAGNAMSSTVVGAAMLSALISAYAGLPRGEDGAMEIDNFPPITPVSGDLQLKQRSPNFAEYCPMSVATAIEAASRTFRMCVCEGRSMVTKCSLSQCVDCHHTACVKCAGQPSHNYASVDQNTIGARGTPEQFEEAVKKALPMKVTIAGIGRPNLDAIRAKSSLKFSKEDEANWKAIVDAIGNALDSELRFQSVLRSEVWTVQYESEAARMELVIGSNQPEWLLFAKPPGKDPVKSRARQILRQPIARMRPVGDDLTKGPWQLWLNNIQGFKASVAGNGGLTDSFENLQGLTKFENTMVWKEYKISVPSQAMGFPEMCISGTYKLLQNCGMSSGSLHINLQSSATLPLFLFLDPDPIGDPKKDFFVFSTDKRRLNYGETRQRIARLDSTWRPPMIETRTDPETPGVLRIKAPETTSWIDLPKSQALAHTEIFVDGQWVDIPKAHFETSRGAESVFSVQHDFKVRFSEESCYNAHVVLSCKSTLPNSETSPWRKNHWIEINQVNQKEFFTSFAWLTEKARVLHGLQKWRTVSCKEFGVCKTCSPPLPKIRWKLDEKSKLVPFEDPQGAIPFERAIKIRPPPLVTQVIIEKSGLTQLKIAVNPQTLVHRAAAPLDRLGKTQLMLSWRLVTNSVTPAKASLPEFTLKNNNSNEGSAKPPGFLFDLRPEQSRSLAWMISQEDENIKPFTEVEVEEAVIPQIGWRLEGRAEKSVTVRGGVCADQVGYGKTIITLGLIDFLRERDREAAKLSVKGFIPLKATLIMVPPQLTEQWGSEIQKFLSKSRKYKVMFIKTLQVLEKYTIADFQDADIIIASWKICEGENYLFRLAQFAGMVELPEKSSGRAETVWYEHAIDEITGHVDILKSGGTGLQDIIETKRKVNEAEAALAETYVPSRRLRGEAYQKAKQSGASKKGAEAQEVARTKKRHSDAFGIAAISKGKKTWTSLQGPLLELFQFRRIVVDEYTYATGKENLTILNLSSEYRWVLSATPPLQDFADIWFMARFLGINLGRNDFTPGVLKLQNIKHLMKDMTSSEEFQSFKLSQSPAWHENRHAVAQRFLDQFVRQNIADISEIPGSNHFVTFRQPGLERSFYLEIMQRLAATDFKIQHQTVWDSKKTKKKANKNTATKGAKRAKIDYEGTEDETNDELDLTIDGNDRAQRLQDALSGSKSAAEALVKSATPVIVDDIRILELRKQQYDGLTEIIQSKIKQAEWLLSRCPDQTCSHYEDWKRCAKSNRFGDLQTTEEISRLISNGEANCDKNDWKMFYYNGNKPEESDLPMLPKGRKANMDSNLYELRDVTNDLSQISKELVNRRRGLRFFESVNEVQNKKGCSCSKCRKTGLSPQENNVMLACGHFVCDNCRKITVLDQDDCPVPGCTAKNRNYEVIKAAELAFGDASGKLKSSHGKKLQGIIQLMKSIPGEEQAILFVQFQDLAADIMSAFDNDGISYLSLGDSNKDQAKMLTEFQTNTGKNKKKVLILNIGDASAAGSNLTNANHVVFVSPYVTTRQQTYDAAMTQAIGRARRYGQRKPVHIYQFVTLKTIDVDIIESRSSKILANGIAPTPEFLPFATFVPSTFGLQDKNEGENGEYGSAVIAKMTLEDESDY